MSCQSPECIALREKYLPEWRRLWDALYNLPEFAIYHRTPREQRRVDLASDELISCNRVYGAESKRIHLAHILRREYLD